MKWDTDMASVSMIQFGINANCSMWSKNAKTRLFAANCKLNSTVKNT